MTEVKADYCVSCLPLTILQRLDVNLSPETVAAVKATPYSPSAKMGLQMKRRFWEEDDRIFGGHLLSNLPFGNFSYPSWGYFGEQGDPARLLRQRPDVGRDQHADQGTDRARADARQQGPSADPRGVQTAYCTFWEKTPYSLGAFAAGGGGGNSTDRLAALGETRSSDLSRMRGASAETAAGRKARWRPRGNRSRRCTSER